MSLAMRPNELNTEINRLQGAMPSSLFVIRKPRVRRGDGFFINSVFDFTQRDCKNYLSAL